MRLYHKGEHCDVIPNWFSFLSSFQSDSVKYKALTRVVEQEGDGIKLINTHLANLSISIMTSGGAGERKQWVDGLWRGRLVVTCLSEQIGGWAYLLDVDFRQNITKWDLQFP